MSQELKEFFEVKFVPNYDANTKSFPAYLQEEYLTSEGWLDKAYICKNLKLHMSTATFRKVVKQVFGITQFTIMPTETELTKEEFLEQYTFGKFTSARGWVGSMYSLTGKVVRREDVFNWIAGF